MSERLDAIKARAEVVAGKPDNREPTEKEWDALTDGAIHDVPALVSAVEAVLALHKRVEWGGEDRCYECTDHEGYPITYPCETVEVIRTALGEGV